MALYELSDDQVLGLISLTKSVTIKGDDPNIVTKAETISGILKTLAEPVASQPNKKLTKEGE